MHQRQDGSARWGLDPICTPLKKSPNKLDNVESTTTIIWHGSARPCKRYVSREPPHRLPCSSLHIVNSLYKFWPDFLCNGENGLSSLPGGLHAVRHCLYGFHMAQNTHTPWCSSPIGAKGWSPKIMWNRMQPITTLITLFSTNPTNAK